MEKAGSALVGTGHTSQPRWTPTVFTTTRARWAGPRAGQFGHRRVFGRPAPGVARRERAEQEHHKSRGEEPHRERERDAEGGGPFRHDPKRSGSGAARARTAGTASATSFDRSAAAVAAMAPRYHAHQRRPPWTARTNQNSASSPNSARQQFGPVLHHGDRLEVQRVDGEDQTCGERRGH